MWRHVGGGPGQAQSGAAWDTEPWRATAKISDFGLSMKLDPAAGHISNMRQGTPFYAAPEVRDAGFLSKAADTFSFGAHASHAGRLPALMCPCVLHVCGAYAECIREPARERARV